jgi:hypothetical protein
MAVGFGTIASAAVEPGPTPTQMPTSGGQAGRSIAADDDPRPYDPFVFQTIDDCRPDVGGNRYLSGSGDLRGKIVNHFQWCVWATGYGLVLDAQRNQVAHVRFRMTAITTGAEQDRNLTTFVYIDRVKFNWRSKMNSTNTHLTITPSCALDSRGGTCTFTPSPVGTKSLSTMQATPTGITLRSTANAGGNPLEIMPGLMNYRLTLSSTAEGGTLPPSITNMGQTIRCDSAHLTQIAYKNPACIFSDVLPILNLNANNVNVDESVLHIRDAQDHPELTLPLPSAGQTKVIPSILTRHWMRY